METLFRVEGKMSTFGGPKDTGMKADEGLALFSTEQAMINHGLADFLLSEAAAKAQGLGRRLNPEKPYLACRWWDTDLKPSFLRDCWAWVENPKTGVRQKARPVDAGPAEWTGRVADLSPGLAKSLGLKTNDICIVTITDETAESDGPAEARDHELALATLTLNLASKGPRIYTTSEWGAKPSKVSYFPQHKAVGIVIHNTQWPNRAPYEDDAKEREAAFQNARDIQADHMAPVAKQGRGWSDTGQHFTVSQGGVITEGRHGTLDAAKVGNVVRGAHSPGANDDWWGIEIAGNNTSKFVVTPPQWEAVIRLCTWLNQLCGRSTGDNNLLQVQPHNHFKSTDCPGKIKDHLEELKKEVENRLK